MIEPFNAPSPLPLLKRDLIITSLSSLLNIFKIRVKAGERLSFPAREQWHGVVKSVSQSVSHPTDFFTISQPQHQEIGEFYVARERRARILKLQSYKRVGRVAPMYGWVDGQPAAQKISGIQTSP